MRLPWCRWCVVIAIGFFVAACGGAEVAQGPAVDETVEDPQTLADEAENPTALADDSPPTLRFLSFQVNPRLPLTRGNEVIITFNGGNPGVPGEVCSEEYEGDVVEESADVVSVRVSGGKWFADADSGYACEDVGFEWAMSVELAEPLGDRQLVVNGNNRNSRPLETRRQPTWLPDGFITYSASDSVPQASADYGLPGNDSGTLRVEAGPPGWIGLEFLADQEGFEALDIFEPGDGGVVWNPWGPTLGFERDGWAYRISTDINVTREDLLQFARSFRTSAEIDPAELPEELRAEPLNSFGTQPGTFAN